MYEELVKQLRAHAKEHCPLDGAYGICGCIIARESANAIEELSKRVPPVPHGRLGDLDALKAKAIERSEKCGEMVNVLDKVITAYDISTAPTIIPAEEGET